MRAGIEKRPIVPGRVRVVPENFSWIDRRFIGDRLIESLTRDEILLYLFLVTVSDRDGLSFYGDATIAALLKIRADDLEAARTGLVGVDLIAFRRPLYQVLSLQSRERDRRPPSTIGEVLRDLGRPAATEDPRP